jgi:hypothetical protein
LHSILQVEGNEAPWLVGNRFQGQFVMNVKHNFIFYASMYEQLK